MAPGSFGIRTSSFARYPRASSICRSTIARSNPLLHLDEQSSQTIFTQFIVQPCPADLEKVGRFYAVTVRFPERVEDTCALGLRHCMTSSRPKIGDFILRSCRWDIRAGEVGPRGRDDCTLDIVL